MRQLLQWFRVSLAAGAFIGFGLGAPLVGLVLPFAWALGGTRLERRRRCQRIVGGTFRLFHAYMRGVGLILYRPHLTLPPREGARVLVANHPTLVDVTAILGAYPEACCLVKSGIYNSPLFFMIMKFCGHIRVERDRAEAGGEVLRFASERLDEGSDVLLFPEGTRTAGDSMGDFHAGAFAVAVHCEKPVAPVAIFCSKPVLKRGTPWYLIPPEPVTIQLQSLGLVHPEADESIQSLRDRVRQILLKSLNPPASSLP